MANFNGQDDREDDNIEVQDNPEFNARLRHDIQAAIATPERGEFRSRRVDIMTQIRAEAASNGVSKPESSPVDFTQRRAEQEKGRSFFGIPAWAGTLAASLVVLVVAALVWNLLTNRPDNAQTVGGIQDTANPAQKTMSTPTGESMGVAASAPQMATTAAATTAASLIQPAGTPMAASAVGGAANAAGAAAMATTAAATTAAATRAAATTAAATTAATSAATTAAAATARTLPTATQAPVSATFSLDAAFGEFPVYPQASSPSVVTDTKGVADFLRGQATIFVKNEADRQRWGLTDQTILSYRFSISKISNEKTENILSFYKNVAANLGYKLESETTLQNDNNLQVRWLYFSKAEQKTGLLTIEVANSTSMNITDFAGVKRGEIGIFLAKSP